MLKKPELPYLPDLSLRDKMEFVSRNRQYAGSPQFESGAIDFFSSYIAMEEKYRIPADIKKERGKLKRMYPKLHRAAQINRSDDLEIERYVHEHGCMPVFAAA